MPFIEENDLLDLHKDIEKSQIINERLLDQIKFKNKDLKGLKLQRNILAGVAIILIFGIFGFFSWFSGLRTSNDIRSNDNLTYAMDSIDMFKARVANLKAQNDELSLVKEFYLAKQFLEKEKVYSVQVKSFVDNNVTLASDALTNTLFAKANPYYSYSIGTYETLEEAQELRRMLVAAGIKDAFVASYKEGKRLKIEPAN